jgi:dihydrolipoamide dehydrogenase
LHPQQSVARIERKFWETKHDLAQHGIQSGPPTLDLAAMLQRKVKVVSTLTRGVEALFKKNKITRYLGHGHLDGKGRVVVTNAKEKIELKAKHIVLAPGSQPATLPGIKLDGDRIGTSTEALSYPEVPKHLVVIGAGYIGLELGSVWCRLGSRVTVLEYLDRILFGIDAEIAPRPKNSSKSKDWNFDSAAKSLARASKMANASSNAKASEPLRCDRVLVAVGRVPNTEHLGLESVGIELHKKGYLPVNDHFATSAEGIYAIGDVIAGPMLAHKAEEEGVACVEYLATGYGHVNYDTIAGVVFTQPEIASVGKTEEQLKEAAIDYRKGVFPFRANARARTIGQVEGTIKVLTNAKTDRVLGVHILGARAGELINEAAVAISFGASSEDLARTSHVHPTLGEALREASLAAGGRPIHV